MRFRQGEVEEANPAITAEALDDVRQVQLALLDPAAFAPLYLQYRSQVYRLCYRAAGNAIDAEDLTSQVFHKTLARLDAFRGGSFDRWIVTVAVNTIRDFHRTRRWHTPLPDLRADPAPGPEEEAIRSDDRALLHALLATLPDDQREVVLLRLSGYSGAEIAELLGRSPEAVRKAQERAVKHMARRIDLSDNEAHGEGGAR